VKVSILDKQNKKVGDLELSSDVFGSDLNMPLIHQVVTAKLAEIREGNACTKDRGEVSGSTKKLFKQKGTGGARQGSIKAPHHTGGGIAFGPHPRSYEQKVNKKMQKSAIRSALSQRVSSNAFYVVDNLQIGEIKTKRVVELLGHFKINNCLIIDNANTNLVLSARNLYKVKTLKPEQVNVYDVVRYDNIIISKDALNLLEQHLS
jgi:large subunit ribosomal protein L4